MTALKIIAILGIVIGAVSLVVDFKKSGKKNIGVFIALIITSAALLAISIVAEGKLGVKPVQQPVAPIVQDDAEVPAVLDLSDPSIPDDEAAGNTAQPEQPVAEPTEKPAEPEQPVAEPTEKPAEPEQPVAEPTENAAEPEQPVAEPTENAAEPNQDTQTAPADEPALEEDPLAPTADAGKGIDEARVNEKIVFSGTKSKKKKASLKTFLWDFGDGTTATGKEVTHAYSAPGMYIATLTVMDKDDRFGVATRIINVNRPENKVRFVHQKLDGLNGESEPDLTGSKTLTGKTTKAFEASQMVLDVSAKAHTASHGQCELVVKLTGPGCEEENTKTVDGKASGTESSVKTSCKGEVGEYTWTVMLVGSKKYPCSWTDIKVDGYEY